MVATLETLNSEFLVCCSHLKNVAESERLPKSFKQSFNDLFMVMRQCQQSLEIDELEDCFGGTRGQVEDTHRVVQEAYKLLHKASQALKHLEANLQSNINILTGKAAVTNADAPENENTKHSRYTEHLLKDMTEDLPKDICSVITTVICVVSELVRIVPSADANYKRFVLKKLKHANVVEIQSFAVSMSRMDPVGRIAALKTYTNLKQLREQAAALAQGITQLDRNDLTLDMRIFVKHLHTQVRRCFDGLGLASGDTDHPFFDKRVHVIPELVPKVVEVFAKPLKFLERNKVDGQTLITGIPTAIEMIATALADVYELVPFAKRRASWQTFEELMDHPKAGMDYVRYLDLFADMIKTQDPVASGEAFRISRNKETFLLSLIGLCHRRLVRLSKAQGLESLQFLTEQCAGQLERISYCAAAAYGNDSSSRVEPLFYCRPFLPKPRNHGRPAILESELFKICEPIQCLSRSVHDLMCSTPTASHAHDAAELALVLMRKAMDKTYAAAPNLEKAVRFFVSVQVDTTIKARADAKESLPDAIKQIRWQDRIFAEEGAKYLESHGYKDAMLLAEESSDEELGDLENSTLLD